MKSGFPKQLFKAVPDLMLENVYQVKPLLLFGFIISHFQKCVRLI